MKDRFGVSVAYEYDGQGRLTKILDPFRTYMALVQCSIGGQWACYAPAPTWIQLTYNSYGLSQILEPGANGVPATGRTTLVGVATDSTLQSITDPDGVATTLAYDQVRRLWKFYDRAGSVTQYSYDATSWKLSGTALPAIPVDPGSGGSPIMTSLAASYRPWQTVGVPTASTASTAPPAAVVDSVIGHVTSAGGSVDQWTVNRWGQPLRYTDPIGNVTTHEYQSTLVSRITDPTGAVDNYTYSGPLLTAMQPAGQDQTNIHYGAFAQPDSIWGPNRTTIGLTLGTRGEVKSARRVGGSYQASFYYGDKFRVDSVRDAAGHLTRYHYDALYGNLDTVYTVGSVSTGFGKRWSSRVYDDYGRVIRTTVSGQAQYAVEYDLLNRVRKVWTVGGPAADTVRTYYGVIAADSVRDGNGQVYRTDYNALGWPTRYYDPDSAKGSVSWTYDSSGHVRRYTNRRGDVLNLRYDGIGRLTAKWGANTSADSFAYTPNGLKLVGWNSVSRDSIFLAPVSGWTDSIVTIIAGRRFSRRYTPDSKLRLKRESIVTPTSGAGTLAFADRRFFWNPSTELLDSLVVDRDTVRIAANNERLIETVRWRTGLLQTRSYTSKHQLYRTAYSHNPVNHAFWRGYQLDSLGALTSIVDLKSGLNQAGRPEGFTFFSYDRIGRLVRSGDVASISSNFGCYDWTGAYGSSGTDNDYGYLCAFQSGDAWNNFKNFSFDAVGNVTRDSTTFNNGTTAVASADYNVGNRISRFNAFHTDHDADGNLTLKRSSLSIFNSTRRVYSWSADNRLTSVFDSVSGVTTQFAYDAFGQLVRKSSNGTPDRYFLWSNGQMVAELDATAQSRVAEYSYLPGIDAPFALITGAQSITKRRFFAQDETGNVIGLFDLDPLSVSVQFGYEAWGRSTSTPGSGIADTNRLRWKGLIWDGTTGLYYVRNRWYDPDLRSYLSEDPVGISGGINTYAYGGGDPINSMDPLGLSSDGLQGEGDDGGGHEPFGDQAACSLEARCSSPGAEDMWRSGARMGRGAGPVGNGAGVGWGGSPVGAPTLLESFIPFWGPARAAINDFQTGHPVSGTLNAVFAISDVLLVGSVIRVGARVATKGTGILWRSARHSSTWGARGKWAAKIYGIPKRGELGHKQVHHWLIERGTAFGKRYPHLVNQPWNFLPMEEIMHQVGMHGNGGERMNLLLRLTFGTPTWAKAAAMSTEYRIVGVIKD